MTLQEHKARPPPPRGHVGSSCTGMEEVVDAFRQMLIKEEGFKVSNPSHSRQEEN